MQNVRPLTSRGKITCGNSLKVDKFLATLNMIK